MLRSVLNSESNHSPDFYRQLAVFMPDWRERKKLLEKSVVVIF
ncbi:M48 family metallopeptidase [bacterium]|nr:M48 family metallopeptidase [bacterium]